MPCDQPEPAPYSHLAAVLLAVGSSAALQHTYEPSARPNKAGSLSYCATHVRAAGHGYFQNSTFGEEDLFDNATGKFVGSMVMNTAKQASVFIQPGQTGPDLPDARWLVESTGKAETQS
jgi:hypothetical protein